MNINLLDPASFKGGHPHDQYDWLRENDPVHWHNEPDGRGFWAITRYEDVYNIGRNAEVFSSEPTIMIQDPAEDMPTHSGSAKMMLMMDPPEHTAYRKLISREFTQGPARHYNERIEQLAEQIVDRVADKGQCEFVSEIAGEMPSFVIADLMGLPLDDGRELYKLTEVIHTAPGTLPENAIPEAVMKMFEYGSAVIAEKRANPGDDLASKLLTAEVEGRTLTDEEFLLFFMLLIDAGGDTTRNLVATGMYELLKHPDQLSLLRSDIDQHLPSARDELLRWTSPVIYMRRSATRDTKLGDKDIRAGDKVVMYYGAANRDPAVFANPHTLDITRNPNKHLAFGGGHHVCLGQWFARLEIDAIMHEVLTRLSDFEMAGDAAWMPSNFISGLTSMPLKFVAQH
ncbi:MAG: cytochrome P450 [Pseudomonadales bacterium]|nr:cytochrome P450 [Pseudomonadales bacterium]MBO6658866.1 cytochrome P450 [Pseudomonadales bacterium]